MAHVDGICGWFVEKSILYVKINSFSVNNVFLLVDIVGWICHIHSEQGECKTNGCAECNQGEYSWVKWCQGACEISHKSHRQGLCLQ